MICPACEKTARGALKDLLLPFPKMRCAHCGAAFANAYWTWRRIMVVSLSATFAFGLLGGPVGFGAETGVIPPAVALSALLAILFCIHLAVQAFARRKARPYLIEALGGAECIERRRHQTAWAAGAACVCLVMIGGAVSRLGSESAADRESRQHLTLVRDLPAGHRLRPEDVRRFTQPTDPIDEFAVHASWISGDDPDLRLAVPGRRGQVLRWSDIAPVIDPDRLGWITLVEPRPESAASAESAGDPDPPPAVLRIGERSPAERARMAAEFARQADLGYSDAGMWVMDLRSTFVRYDAALELLDGLPPPPDAKRWRDRADRLWATLQNLHVRLGAEWARACAWKELESAYEIAHLTSRVFRPPEDLAGDPGDEGGYSTRFERYRKRQVASRRELMARAFPAGFEPSAAEERTEAVARIALPAGHLLRASDFRRGTETPAAGGPVALPWTDCVGRRMRHDRPAGWTLEPGDLDTR